MNLLLKLLLIFALQLIDTTKQQCKPITYGHGPRGQNKKGRHNRKASKTEIPSIQYEEETLRGSREGGTGKSLPSTPTFLDESVMCICVHILGN